MKPAPFDYAAPESLDEAVALLAQHGEEAKVLAGGQSLVPLLAFRLASPSVLIDLNRIPGLDGVRLDGDRLVLGALARHRDVERFAPLAGRCPMAAEAVSMIGHVAIRNRGTVGGSLAHADPAAEWPALLAILDGEVEARGPDGTRSIPAHELFTSYFTTTLAPTEIITEARLDLPAGRVGSAFLEFAQRRGDFAIAGVGAVLRLEDDGTVGEARIGLLGVADGPVRARSAEALLVGRPPADPAIDEAAAAIDPDLAPLSDVHGSAEYRRHVAGVLTRRALTFARERAEGGEPADG